MPEGDIDLDVKDRKILYELDLDARQTNSQLAKKVALSKQVMNYRIERLVNRGVIGKFVMVLDTQKLGYSFYDVFIKLQNMTTEEEQGMIDFLMSMDTVGWLAKSMGKYDLVIALFTKDVKQFNNSLNIIFNKYGNYIKEKTFIIDIDAVYCKNKYLLKNPDSYLRKDELYGDRESANLEKGDMLILKTLDQDPRMSILELSRRTGFSFDTVRRKLKHLTDDKIIQGFKIKINPSAFGYEWYVLLLELNIISDEDRGKLIRYLQNNKNAVYIINTIGNWNMMVDLHLKNYNHFQQFLAQLKKEFGGIIKSHEHLTITKDCKTTFVPERAE
jgi:DNA-binding Lrp family transcriptional regulator